MRFFLFAVVVVSATPVLAQSLPGQQASRLVLLAGEPGSKTIALPPPPPAANVQFGEDPFTPVYRRMASMQLQLLEVQKVPLAGPLTVTLFGGSAVVIGITMMLLGAASYGFLIVGLIVLGGSSLPLLIGIPWLAGAVSTNDRINREIEKVKREQRQLNVRPVEQGEGAVLGTF